MRRFRSIGLALGAAVLALASGHASPSVSAADAGGRWQVVALGDMGRAVALNDRGQVAGVVGTHLPGENPSYHAFLWSSGRMRDLGTLPLGGRLDMPNSSQPVAINDRGQVAGTSQVEQNGPQPHAFLWQDGTMTDLRCPRAPRRCRGSVAVAIDERGTVAGAIGDPTIGGEPLRATVWQDGSMRVLGTLPGRNSSRATSLNERGWVAGTSYTARDDGYELRLRAFLWTGGKLRDIGTLPGDRESEAYAVNDRGQVIGVSYATRDESGAEVTRGFVWQSGRMRSLGRFEPLEINERGQVLALRIGGGSSAYLVDRGRASRIGAIDIWSDAALDDSGRVVGRHKVGGATRAFVWQDGRTTELGTLPGDRESAAVAINARGQIVGWSGGAETQHPVLWNPA